MTDRDRHATITKDELMARLSSVGAYKAGVATVRPVPDDVMDHYSEWLKRGCHAGMTYLENHLEIRRNPELLLPGAKSIICCAFNYYTPPSDSGTPEKPVGNQLKWACYALGDDYHEVIRERLSKVTSWLTETCGHECRICIDTAPIFERYWAVQAGLGFIGLNRQLILPGAGSRFFLAEILTTLPLEADSPCTLSCGSCHRCLTHCPGHALNTQTPKLETQNSKLCLDARKCLSYLTIEHRGDLPDGVKLGSHIYGCDECQDICPHNCNSPATTITEFTPRPEILNLTTADILAMDRHTFSTLFCHSAIKRTKLAGLLRNATYITQLTHIN